MRKYIICCDFDGVLHSYTSGWKGATVIPDPPVAGAMRWVVSIVSDPRFELVVYSSRSKEQDGVMAMRGWLHRHLVEHFQVAEGYDEKNALDLADRIFFKIKFPTQKPAASMTIDDRAFCFRGQFPSEEWLLSFKPWNKHLVPEQEYPRPESWRLEEIRKALQETPYGLRDPSDHAIGELLAEIEHLRGGR